jgi:hypothetical protein
MEPIEFAQQTTVFAKDQPEYLPLPAHVSPDGQVTSCWELTDAELATLQRTRKLWITQLTFNQMLQPILPQVFSPFIPQYVVEIKA